MWTKIYDELSLSACSVELLFQKNPQNKTYPNPILSGSW